MLDDLNKNNILFNVDVNSMIIEEDSVTINKLMAYILALHNRGIEISLKTEFSVHYGWVIEIIRKGYDIPIIEHTGYDLPYMLNCVLKKLIEYEFKY